jgi:hypothetical protein
MHPIEMDEMTGPFMDCWAAAGQHLDAQVQGGIRFWLRAHPHPPFLEHLSFRLGNQLFLVRVEDADGGIHGPGTVAGLLAAARGMGGHACVLPMRRSHARGTWTAARAGWGLVSVTSGQPVDPFSLVTDEKIAMSPWEVHDFAVQVVRAHIEREGHTVSSWQGNPEADPSIWFVDSDQRPGWVVVRAARFPDMDAARPSNWTAIEAGCRSSGGQGYFASVAVVSGAQPFRGSDEKPVPLWRGHPLHVRFQGLTKA